MGNYIIIKIIGIIFIVSYLTTFLAKKIAHHVNAIDIPNKRSKHTLHTSPIPRMGGLALFISLLIGCIFFIDASVEIVSILIGSVVIVVIGIIDDIKPVKAYYKFIVQIIGALIVVLYGGIYFTEISLFGYTWGLNVYLAQFLSIFLILSITNAINLIDGLDGLATGLGLIYFLTIGAVGFILNKMTGIDMKLTMVMIGATLGFLIHNFPPAKIFLGDTGSMFLGYIITIIALLGLKEGTIPSIIIPILALGIPIFDTVMAILRRMFKRKKISSPDIEHFHHQVLKLKLSNAISIFIIYGINILFSLLAIFYMLKSVIASVVLFVILFAILMFVMIKTTIIFPKKHKKSKKSKKNKKSKKSKKTNKIKKIKDKQIN